MMTSSSKKITIKIDTSRGKGHPLWYKNMIDHYVDVILKDTCPGGSPKSNYSDALYLVYTELRRIGCNVDQEGLWLTSVTLTEEQMVEVLLKWS